MKKLLITTAAIFVFLSASFGQIARDASDSIVLERMNTESRPHTVYAKMDTTAIATRAGELLELDYPCWIYYIHYDDQAEYVLAARRYLVVKESSGNVLEVRTMYLQRRCRFFIGRGLHSSTRWRFGVPRL